MQIIRPDMLPLMVAILILTLIFIGLVGLISIRFGLKNIRTTPQKTRPILLVISGLLCISFSCYNWMGYQKIFSEGETKIIGTYFSENDSIWMHVNADKSWFFEKEDHIFLRGNWEYIMSEDGAYWNINADNLTYHTQTRSVQKIVFMPQELTLKKIKTP